MKTITNQPAMNITIVTPSDHQPSAQVRVYYYERKEFLVNLTKEELIEWEFNTDNIHQLPEDRFIFKTTDTNGDPNVAVVDKDLFNQWLDEYESQPLA